MKVSNQDSLIFPLAEVSIAVTSFMISFCARFTFILSNILMIFSLGISFQYSAFAILNTPSSGIPFFFNAEYIAFTAWSTLNASTSGSFEFFFLAFSLSCFLCSNFSLSFSFTNSCMLYFRILMLLEYSSGVLQGRYIVCIIFIFQYRIVMSQIQIGNYLISLGQVLGKGSTGTVYLGLDVRNGAQVAIKVIELKNITNEVTKYLLDNEVKALQLSNHPSVLKAHDVIYDSNNCYVITNYCPNNTLEHYIKARGRIPEDEAIKIFRQIVDGYVNLSVNRILHRDLKPSNILFTDKYLPVICDFGYCQIAGFKSKPRLQYNVGSPAYMAPESITKNMYSESSEVWSLGTILYEMLQGRSFAHGRDVMEAVMDIKRRGPYFPDGVSDFSKRIIKDCMALQPHERMRLKDLVAALRSVGISKSSEGSINSSPLKTSVNNLKVSVRRDVNQTRADVFSVPPRMVQQHGLENLQMAQQQLQQPSMLNVSTRNGVPTQEGQRFSRSTMPAQLSNVPRARSTQPMNPQGLTTKGERLATQQQIPATERFSVPPEVPANISQQREIIERTSQIQRPSTSKVPQRVPSITQLNQTQQYEHAPTITELNRTFINPQDYIESVIHNASYRSQPVFLNGVDIVQEESILESHPSSFLQTNGLDRTNTIQNINASLMNKHGSMRSLIAYPMLSSKRTTSSFRPQEQRLTSTEVQQQVQQIQQMQQMQNISQVQQLQQISQQIPLQPQFQPQNLNRLPMQSSGRLFQEEINKLHQSPFLKQKTQISTPTHHHPPTPVVRSRIPQQQMVPQGIVNGSRRPHQPQSMPTMLHMQPMGNMQYAPLQTRMLVSNRR